LRCRRKAATVGSGRVEGRRPIDGLKGAVTYPES